MKRFREWLINNYIELIMNSVLVWLLVAVVVMIYRVIRGIEQSPSVTTLITAGVILIGWVVWAVVRYIRDERRRRITMNITSSLCGKFIQAKFDCKIESADLVRVMDIVHEEMTKSRSEAGNCIDCPASGECPIDVDEDEVIDEE